MQKALDIFHTSLDRVTHLGGLHAAVGGLTTSAVDTSDLLRAQIVLLVSAFDFYVHEVTVIGMVDVFKGKRPQTTGFLKYKVSLGALSSGNSDWFESEVREKHGFLSFQQPEKVADAVRLFSTVKLWDEISSKTGIVTTSLKQRLALIVERRNKIAHEADLDPSYPGARWPISEGDVDASIKFISMLGDKIYEVV